MMKRHTWFVVLLVFLQSALAGPVELEDGVNRLSDDLVDRFSQYGTAKVAVVEFTELNGYSSALDQYLAEKLITALLTKGRGAIHVVERHQLRKVLLEQKLDASGLFEPEAIAKVGRLLGVDAIVTGTVADLGSEIDINARAISVESGRVFAAASARIAKNDRVRALMNQGVATPIRNSDAAGSPSSSAGVFRNKFLELRVRELARSRDGRKILVALSLENLTTTPLYLAVPIEAGQCAFQAIDDQGGTSRHVQIAGLPCRFSKWLTHKQYYAELSGNGRTAITMKFTVPDAQSAKRISFTGRFVRLVNGKPEAFVVGITGQRLSGVP